jgi:hypothetical protein
MKKSKLLSLPFIGRLAVVFDRHGVGVAGASTFQTNLSVKVLDKNGNERKVRDYFGGNRFQRLWYAMLYRNKTELDLGSGLVTNVGVLALASSYGLANPSGTPFTPLATANYHVSGTGTTAAAATDIKLQTQSTAGGQTPVAGVQSLISAANLQKYQTVATIAYTGTEAVTEWGLLCGTIAGAISGTTGTPFTAGSATTGTVTGTPYTASTTTVGGQEMTVFENTGNATPHWGLVLSNTTSVVTVPAWYKVSDGTAAGTTPANTNAFTIRPVLWDHKVFSAINVNSGDSIQFTYQLTVVSGG